jgi:hypothetical protein
MLPAQLGAVGAGLSAFSLGATAGGVAIAGLAYAVGSKAVAAFQELELEQARYNAVLQATSFAAGKTRLASGLR